jgi:hypothetical protein
MSYAIFVIDIKPVGACGAAIRLAREGSSSVYQFASDLGFNQPRTRRTNCSCSALLSPGKALSDT